MSQSLSLSGLDAAFLALDSPATPMHMGAVGVFNTDRELDVPRLRNLLAERARRIDRLRLRVRSTWLPPGGAVEVAAGLLDDQPRLAGLARAVEPSNRRPESTWTPHPLDGCSGTPPAGSTGI